MYQGIRWYKCRKVTTSGAIWRRCGLSGRLRRHEKTWEDLILETDSKPVECIVMASGNGAGMTHTQSMWSWKAAPDIYIYIYHYVIMYHYCMYHILYPSIYLVPSFHIFYLFINKHVYIYIYCLANSEEWLEAGGRWNRQIGEIVQRCVIQFRFLSPRRIGIASFCRPWGFWVCLIMSAIAWWLFHVHQHIPSYQYFFRLSAIFLWPFRHSRSGYWRYWRCWKRSEDAGSKGRI